MGEGDRRHNGGQRVRRGSVHQCMQFRGVFPFGKEGDREQHGVGCLK